MSKDTLDKYFSPVTPRSAKRQKPSSSPVGLDNLEDNMAATNNVEVGKSVRGEWLAELSEMLDAKLAKLATKDDLATFGRRVEVLETENKLLKQEIQAFKSREKNIVAKLVDLEGRSRRNNLIFRGLKFDDNTKDFRNLVLRFCIDKFGCATDTWVNRAHPLYDRKSVIAHFPVDSDIEYIMARVKRLKGTGFAVHRDLPLEVRRKRAYLAAVREEVERVSPGLSRRMPLIHDHLVIHGSRYTCDDGDLVVDRRNDGARRLAEHTNHDFTDFLARAKQRYLEGAAGGTLMRGPDHHGHEGDGPSSGTEATTTANTSEAV